MIESTQKVVCLSIAEKINSCQPLQVCGLNKIDILITELDPNDPLLQRYADVGIQVI